MRGRCTRVCVYYVGEAGKVVLTPHHVRQQQQPFQRENVLMVGLLQLDDHQLESLLDQTPAARLCEACLRVE